MAGILVNSLLVPLGQSGGKASFGERPGHAIPFRLTSDCTKNALHALS
jgi:hypothetical protein